MTFASLWLTNDIGTHFYACGYRGSVDQLGHRHVEARTAYYELGECCHEVGGVCAIYQFNGDDHRRARWLIAECLARAESRSVRPFTERVSGEPREKEKLV